MCLNPIKIVNPKKVVSLAGGQPFYIEVPCGKCAECQKGMRDSWHFRTYYEAMDIFNSGGYILFDTLTYKDEDLPHLSTAKNNKGDKLCNFDIPEGLDMECFCSYDIQLFMKRLRKYLSVCRKDVSKNLRYFVTSEYGEKKHRPHYHVLFFVKKDFVNWFELSKAISKCWHHGRTDGYPYQPVNYVRTKRVFSMKQCADMDYLMSCCRYVSKYISKSNYFQDLINKRLDKLFVQKYGECWREDDGDKHLDDLYKKIRRGLNQFHRQSQHFGENFLAYNDYDKVFKTGLIEMPTSRFDPDTKKVIKFVKQIPIPMYYQMKIFYDLHKDSSGKSLGWVLNDEGKKYKINRMFGSEGMLVKLKDRVEDWIKSMQAHSYYYDGDCPDEWYGQVKRFLEVNNDRDLGFFAVYLLLYKGRVKSKEQIEREKDGIFVVDDPYDFFLTPFDELKNFGADKFYNYGTSSSKRCLGSKFISNRYLGEFRKDVDNDWSDARLNPFRISNGMYEASAGFSLDIVNYFKGHSDFDFMRYDFFASKYVINDKSDIRFEGYDEMYDIFSRCQYYKNERKQKDFDERERVKNVLKDC